MSENAETTSSHNNSTSNNHADSNASQTSNLDKMIRKIEMQKSQLEMEVRFNKNMALFKSVAPSIYEQYVNYQPEELRLSYDKDGYINLVNYKLDNKPVYASDPKEFTRKQIENYEKRPSLTNISFTKTKEAEDDHFHVHLINNLLDDYKTLSVAKEYHLNTPIGLLLVTGCGLGYHIEELVRKYDVHNLCIFDPHKDSFYASLHTVDWQPIIKNFYRKGRMFKLYIGMSTFAAMADLKLLTDKIGLHNLVYTFVFRHFSSKKEEEFIEKYKKEFHLQASGVGFFEDEQISMAHTVSHLNNRVKILTPRPSERAGVPVFILGNGPSLDKAVDLIKANREKAILFSCGSTLGALCKAGIKPDFHIEMERRRTVREWIESGSTAEFRQGVKILALSTVSPEVTNLFEEAGVAKKPNDLGELIIDKEVTNARVPALPLCNPTVTNTGLAFAIAMGFTEIYLFGVDLGMAETEQHHSSYSVYSDLEKKVEAKDISHLADKKRLYDIKGNHSEFVKTNAHLDQSRINMELLLANFPFINCYNPNNGVYIEGTKTIELKDISLPSPIANKPALINALLDTHFTVPETHPITEAYFIERHLANFKTIKGELSLPKKVKDITQLHSLLNNIYLKVKNLKNTHPATTMLLRGSISSYFTLLINNCLFCKNKDEFQQAYQLGRNAYMEFIDKAYKYLKDEPLRLDNTQDNTFS